MAPESARTDRGEDIVAMQSNAQFDDETLEKIAERMRLRRAKFHVTNDFLQLLG